MDNITWDSSWELGVDAIDADHRLLLEITNVFVGAIDAGRAEAVLGSVLNVLLDYTRHHFAREELLMEHFAVPARAAHLRIHRDLEAQVRRIRDTHLASPDQPLTDQVRTFLRSWLIDHIKGHDLALRVHIRDAAVANRLLVDRLLVDIRNPDAAAQDED